MHGTIKDLSRQSNRRRPVSRTKYFQPLPLVFGDLARMAFPVKTLESIGAELERVKRPRARSTIATWLREIDPVEAPADVAWLVLEKIMRRLNERP